MAATAFLGSVFVGQRDGFYSESIREKRIIRYGTIGWPEYFACTKGVLTRIDAACRVSADA